MVPRIGVHRGNHIQMMDDIAEARKLREMAAKSKAATQMGNQGHCEEGYHRLCEFIWGGVVGIRANTPADVVAIRRAFPTVPLIGLYKYDLPGYEVRITRL